MKRLLGSQFVYHYHDRGGFGTLQKGGFTLPELLIAAILAPIIIVTVANLFTSQVNNERRLIGAQSSENLRSRLAFLLESDIGDGEKIIYPPSASSDPDDPTATLSPSTGCESAVGNLFTIASPYFSSGAISHACIIYSIKNGNLVREGPPILQNGSLDYSEGNLEQVVAQDIGLSITSGSQTTISFDITLPSFTGSPSRTYSVAYGTKNFRVGT